MTVEEAVQEVTILRTNIGNDVAYAFMKKFHRYLTDHYILNTQLFRIGMTAGTYNYTLDTSIRRVRTATFKNSATSYIRLNPESSKDWDIKYACWRDQPNQDPIAFGAEEGQLLLRGTPTTTSAGAGASMYPRIDVWASVETNLALTDTLPPDVYVDVYTTGTILKWAEFYCPGDVQLLSALLKDQLDSLQYSLAKTSHNFRPRQTPAEMYQRQV